MDDNRVKDALAHIEAAQSFIVAQTRIYGATALTENAMREFEKAKDLLNLRATNAIPDNSAASPDPRRKLSGKSS